MGAFGSGSHGVRALNGAYVGVDVVVEQYCDHVWAHHLGRDVKWRLPGRPHWVVDVAGAELQQSLDDLPAAVPHGVVQRECLIEVEPP